MELWWEDPSDAPGDRRANAIRVRLQADLTADYVTYCFYMDLTQLWDSRRALAGARRMRLLGAVDRIQDICGRDRAPSLDIDNPIHESPKSSMPR